MSAYRCNWHIWPNLSIHIPYCSIVLKNFPSYPFKNFQFHRSTEWLRLEETSGGRLVQPSAKAGTPSAMFRCFLKISKDRDCTASLGNMCQCLVIPTVKKCFLLFRGNFVCSSLCTLHKEILAEKTKNQWTCTMYLPICQSCKIVIYYPVQLKVLINEKGALRAFMRTTFYWNHLFFLCMFWTAA